MALPLSSAVITSSCCSGAEPHEWLFMSAAAIRFELSQAAPVKILQIGVSAGEREIDVIEDVGVARSRLAGRAGHEPFGERGDRGGVGVVEERAMLSCRSDAARRELRRRPPFARDSGRSRQARDPLPQRLPRRPPRALRNARRDASCFVMVVAPLLDHVSIFCG